MLNLIKLIRYFIKKVRHSIELRKYNDFTIAEYFGKQGATIGENNRLMIRSLGPEPYLIKIGNHCSISAGASLITHDGGGWIFTHEIPSLQRFGKIEIRDNCYIGANCIILPNVIIGPNSIVGAGSIVTKDVPPNTIVAGNPAKVIKTIDSYKEKITRIWEIQRPQGYLNQLKENTFYNSEDIHRHKIKPENRNLLKKHLIRLFWG